MLCSVALYYTQLYATVLCTLLNHLYLTLLYGTLQLLQSVLYYSTLPRHTELSGLPYLKLLFFCSTIPCTTLLFYYYSLLLHSIVSTNTVTEI